MFSFRSVSVIVVVGIVCVASTAAAQNQVPVGNATISIVPVKPVAADDGAKLYDAYCASCHGKDGKGLGPASRFAHVRPTDLTAISAEHPRTDDCIMHVLATLNEAHRSEADMANGHEIDMPHWRTVLASISQNRALADLRMANIAKYVASIQPPLK